MLPGPFAPLHVCNFVIPAGPCPLDSITEEPRIETMRAVYARQNSE